MRPPIKTKPIFWESQDGRTFESPADMEDRHVVNLIRWMDRNWRKAADRLAFMADSLAATLSGDIAGWTLEHEAAALYEAEGPQDVWWQYEALVDEAYRRGLEAGLEAADARDG